MFHILLLLSTLLVPSSIVRLEIGNGDEMGICSGIVYNISDKGEATIVTAAHCIPDGTHIDVTVNRKGASLIEFNRLLDIAALKVKASNDMKPIPFAKEKPEMGEDIEVFGYAFGFEDIVTQHGNIAQVYNKETKHILLDAMVIPGDSGGVVVNKNGEFVGLVVAGISTGGTDHLGVATSAAEIKDFVDNIKQKDK